jgi:hypothetical protein
LSAKTKLPESQGITDLIMITLRLLFAAIVALTNLMLDFPPELTDRFIDQLSDDKAALKTCVLVCRQWFPRSRAHLFSEVTLQVGQVGDRHAPDDIETFLGLV